MGKRRGLRTTDFDLSIEEVSQRRDMGQNTFLIHGMPGIGKTEFASKFPKVLFLATEEGQSFIKCKRIKITSWQHYRAFLNKMPEIVKGFDTIVIDTAGNLYSFCKAFVCQREGVTHPSDQGYAKVWDMIFDEFFSGLNVLAQARPGLVMIAHSKEYRTETPSRGAADKVMIDLQGTGRKVIERMADFILYIGFRMEPTKDKKGRTRRKEARRIITKPEECLEAKDRTGLLPPTLPFDFGALEDAFEEAMEELWD